MFHNDSPEMESSSTSYLPERSFDANVQLKPDSITFIDCSNASAKAREQEITIMNVSSSTVVLGVQCSHPSIVKVSASDNVYVKARCKMTVRVKQEPPTSHTHLAVIHFITLSEGRKGDVNEYFLPVYINCTPSTETFENFKILSDNLSRKCRKSMIVHDSTGTHTPVRDLLATKGRSKERILRSPISWSPENIRLTSSVVDPVESLIRNRYPGGGLDSGSSISSIHAPTAGEGPPLDVLPPINERLSQSFEDDLVPLGDEAINSSSCDPALRAVSHHKLRATDGSRAVTSSRTNAATRPDACCCCKGVWLCRTLTLLFLFLLLKHWFDSSVTIADLTNLPEPVNRMLVSATVIIFCLGYQACSYWHS